MSIISNPLLLRNKSEEDIFEIERSLRFEEGDSPSLSKTFSGTGNRRTWTYSTWVKFDGDSNQGDFFHARDGSGSPWTTFYLDSDFRVGLTWTAGVSANDFTPERLYRDFSGWVHIVIKYDSTQSVEAERIEMYSNGVIETQFNGTAYYPTHNQDIPYMNTNVAHGIGGPTSAASWYLADTYFIDGKALSAAAFGKFDSTGNWHPKALEFPVPNDGTTWSGLVSGTADGSYPKTNAFDGDLAHSSAGLCIPASGQTLHFDPSSDITVNQALRIYGLCNGNGAVLWINNVDYTQEFIRQVGDNAYGWAVFYAKDIGFKIDTTNGIKFKHSGAGTNHAEIAAIEVDGVILIDGQTDQTYAQWAAATSDNANTFHLKYNDTSSNAALGTDSLKSNNFTVSNLVATDGSNPENIDSFVDTPTNYAGSGDDKDGGVTRGNYCTLNPLQNGGLTLSQGNLHQTLSSGGVWKTAGATFAVSSGKWYFEYEVLAGPGSPDDHIVGWAKDDFTTLSGNLWTDNAHSYSSNGWYRYNTGSNIGTVNSYTVGDVIGVAADFTSGNLYFYKNGTAENSGNAVNTTSMTGLHYPIVANWSNGTTCTGSLNFGQRAFKYTNAGSNRPAADYKCLCSTNLPDTFSGDELNDPSKYFDVKPFLGDDTTDGSKKIKYNFSPDLYWQKAMSYGYHHRLFDRIRGQGSLRTDTNDTEGSDVNSTLTTFDSDGVSIENTGDELGNKDAITYIAWAWDAGSSAATASTEGSVTPSAQWVNNTAGFSISKWTVPSSGTYTVGHGLSAKPDFMLLKNLDSANNWDGYHHKVGADYRLKLNEAYGKDDQAGAWNDTEPTSTVFTNTVAWQSAGDNMIAYCWTAIPGFSAFGSFEGTGSADGPFVNTGFAVKWVLFKNSERTAGWQLIDAVRDPINYAGTPIWPNLSNAQGSRNSANGIDILSNGFKIRNTNNDYNYNGEEIIYAAFASHPFKTARAR